jgi:hypothetical protein
VLDIGSPKLLSLFLASRVGANVWATDLVDDFFPPYAAYAASMLGSEQSRYVIETQDARTLTYRDESFDRVFSVSVVEHILMTETHVRCRRSRVCSSPEESPASQCRGATAATSRSFTPRVRTSYWVRSSDRQKVFLPASLRPRLAAGAPASNMTRPRARRSEFLG